MIVLERKLLKSHVLLLHEFLEIPGLQSFALPLSTFLSAYLPPNQSQPLQFLSLGSEQVKALKNFHGFSACAQLLPYVGPQVLGFPSIEDGVHQLKLGPAVN